MHKILEYKNIILQEQDIILDVRTKEEFDNHNLTNVPVLNIELQNLEANLDELKDKKKIYILCAKGIRSAAAYNILSKHKFNNIFIIKGGILAISKPKGKFSIQQQTFIVLALLLLVFLTGSLYFKASLWGIVFMACGLLFAGLTNNCLLQKLLFKLPYNKKG